MTKTTRNEYKREVSRALDDDFQRRMLDAARAESTELLATDCPGCILHLRGGAEKRGMPLRVLPLAEVLAENPGT